MCFLKWNYTELLTKINNRKTIINNSSYYIIKTGFYNCKSGLPYDIHYFKIDLDLLVLDSFNCSPFAINFAFCSPLSAFKFSAIE
jgi:hypothetical protein